MRVIFHPGPHKTATSALQTTLLGCFGTPQPGRIWYPPDVGTNGPGHADLARAALGLQGVARDPTVLRRLLDLAGRGGCETLILSSEEFSLAHQDHLDDLRKALSGADIELVVTLTPICRRGLSTWSEGIKHGEVLSLGRSLGWVLDYPGMKPDFASRFHDALGSSRTRVLVFDPGGDGADAYRLFGHATDLATTLDEQDARMVRANRSVGHVESEVLRVLNRVLTPKDQDFRLRCQDAFLSHFRSEAWTSLVPRRRPALPEHWIQPLRQRITDTISSLEAHSKKAEFEVFGDIGLLDDLPA